MLVPLGPRHFQDINHEKLKVRGQNYSLNCLFSIWIITLFSDGRFSDWHVEFDLPSVRNLDKWLTECCVLKPWFVLQRTRPSWSDSYRFWTYSATWTSRSQTPNSPPSRTRSARWTTWTNSRFSAVFWSYPFNLINWDNIWSQRREKVVQHEDLRKLHREELSEFYSKLNYFIIDGVKSRTMRWT